MFNNKNLYNRLIVENNFDEDSDNDYINIDDNDIYVNNNISNNIPIENSNIYEKSIAIKWIYFQSIDISKGVCNIIYFIIILLNLSNASYLIWFDEIKEPIHKDLGIIIIACINIFIILILFMLKSTHSEIDIYNKCIYEWQHFINLLKINNNIYEIIDKYNSLLKNNKFNPQSIKLFKREFINSEVYKKLILNKDTIISNVLDDLEIV
jgi:hypothetical protein